MKWVTIRKTEPHPNTFIWQMRATRLLEIYALATGSGGPFPRSYMAGRSFSPHPNTFRACRGLGVQAFSFSLMYSSFLTWCTNPLRITPSQPKMALSSSVTENKILKKLAYQHHTFNSSTTQFNPPNYSRRVGHYYWFDLDFLYVSRYFVDIGAHHLYKIEGSFVWRD